MKSTLHASKNIRIYSPSSSVVFWKTTEMFGGLSNMASGFELMIQGTQIASSEALYQALKFSRHLDTQRDIISEPNPWLAKRHAQKHQKLAEKDWQRYRINIMRWVLRVKLGCWPQRFGGLLRETGQKPIVERSSRDNFWGAQKCPNGEFVGVNAMGRLLMELREDVYSGKVVESVQPLILPSASILGISLHTEQKLMPNASDSAPDGFNQVNLWTKHHTSSM